MTVRAAVIDIMTQSDRRIQQPCGVRTNEREDERTEEYKDCIAQNRTIAACTV